MSELTPPGGWLAPSGRVPPLRTDELSLWLRLLFRLLGRVWRRRTGTAVVPDVFLVLLRHPRLFWPWARFAARLMPFGKLDRRDAELVILRTGWNCRCRYEWGQHVQIGLRAGLTAEEIARVAQGPLAAGWSEAQAALLQAADEIHRDRMIADATWQRLQRHYRPKQMLEIPMLAGHYVMLAGVLNSVGLPLEPHTEQALAEAPIHDQKRS